ncbi:unnamed protein product [Gadus morhua 'NCC']
MLPHSARHPGSEGSYLNIPPPRKNSKKRVIAHRKLRSPTETLKTPGCTLDPRPRGWTHAEGRRDVTMSTLSHPRTFCCSSFPLELLLA